MASKERVELGADSNPTAKPGPCAVQPDSKHADRTPARPACPSPLRPRPSPAARIAQSLRAALWPSSAQQQSPGTVAQSDAAYASALARVRQRAAELAATVSNSPRKPPREADAPLAAAAATRPASSSFVLPLPAANGSVQGSGDAATPSQRCISPAESSASVASDPAFWGRGEVGVDGPLTLHMRDSPALSHMLAGITGRSGGDGTRAPRHAADDDQQSQSISFGQGGALFRDAQVHASDALLQAQHLMA